MLTFLRILSVCLYFAGMDGLPVEETVCLSVSVALCHRGPQPVNPGPSRDHVSVYQSADTDHITAVLGVGGRRL